MNTPTFTRTNASSGEGSIAPNDLRFLASIASNHESVTRNIAPNCIPMNHNRPLVTPSHLGQLQNLFNIASCRRPVDSSTSGINTSFQSSGAASLPINLHNNNAQVRNMITQQHQNRSKSYKDDRRGFILFVHVLLKSLGKVRSERELFYKVMSVVRECLSCNRAGVAGYAPLVDIMEARLRNIDGLHIHLYKTEGYMQRYRQKKSSASSVLHNSVVQL